MLTDNELVKRLVRNPLITMDRSNITALAAERITDLLAEVVRLKADLYEGNCELEKQQRINKELQDAIREHRDSFSKDMDDHDWTTEDEALWALVEEVSDE